MSLDSLQVERHPFLVEARLAPPRARSHLVRRERVWSLLDRGTTTDLTVVLAPPGYGKTTAVQEWLGVRGVPSAWITIAAADRRPISLWAHIAAALDRVREGLGRRALHQLRSDAPAIDKVVDEVANALSIFKEPIVLVLDDLHEIGGASIETIGRLIAHLPTNAQLVLISRMDPPLRLPGLRARGALTEIRSDELAFTLAEARELLVVREGVSLSDDAVRALVTRTEGWPAGLYLAALWLRCQPDPAARVSSFAGDARQVADYLTGEVLDSLEEDTRSFLLGTATLGRFNADLCDEVLERRDSAVMLERLTASNLFLVPVVGAGGWYRYHALFAEYLALRFAHDDHAAFTEVHRRAARWFVARDALGDAAEHAIAARDELVLAGLLEQRHPVVARAGDVRALLEWAEHLSNDVLALRPAAALAAALAAGTSARPYVEQMRYIELADRGLRDARPSVDVYCNALRFLVRATRFDGNITEATAAARRGLELATEDAAAGELAVPLLGYLAHHLVALGEYAQALAVGRAAVGHPDASTRPHGAAMAYAARSLALLRMGRPECASGESVKARTILRGAGVLNGWVDAAALHASAHAEAACGRLVTAQRDAEHALRIRTDPDPSLEQATTLVLLASIVRRRGQLSAAAGHLERAASMFASASHAGELGSEHAVELRLLAEASGTALGGPITTERPSAAETAVLQLLSTDLSLREIGDQMYLSRNTVKAHVRAIYRKLGVATRADAVARAGALDLIDAPFMLAREPDRERA